MRLGDKFLEVSGRMNALDQQFPTILSSDSNFPSQATTTGPLIKRITYYLPLRTRLDSKPLLLYYILLRQSKLKLGFAAWDETGTVVHVFVNFVFLFLNFRNICIIICVFKPRNKSICILCIMYMYMYFTSQESILSNPKTDCTIKTLVPEAILSVLFLQIKHDFHSFYGRSIMSQEVQIMTSNSVIYTIFNMVWHKNPASRY